MHHSHFCVISNLHQYFNLLACLSLHNCLLSSKCLIRLDSYHSQDIPEYPRYLIKTKVQFKLIHPVRVRRHIVPLASTLQLDVAREFMSISSAKIDTREGKTGKVTEVFSHIFHNPSRATRQASKVRRRANSTQRQLQLLFETRLKTHSVILCQKTLG